MSAAEGDNPLTLPREGYAEWDARFGREMRLRPAKKTLRARESVKPRRAAYGFVLWEGPSAIGGMVMRSHTGEFRHVRADVPLVLIATFGDLKDANKKTGRMVQTYILVRDVDPINAIRLGLDESNCGFCQHRKQGERTCYVRTDTAPNTVWHAYKRGGYRHLSPGEIGPVFKLLGANGYRMRMGTYGDPAAVPFEVWAEVLGITPEGDVTNLPLAGTCYTHQWQHPAVQPLQAVCMASVDNDRQREQAARMGWRSFQPVSMYRPDERRPGRFRPPTDDEVLIEDRIRRAGGQALCPASEEFETAYGAHRVTCEACRLCSGGLKHGKRDVWIPIHGSGGNIAKRAARKASGNPGCDCGCGCSHNPGDEDMRSLERRAAQGDAYAAARLEGMRARVRPRIKSVTPSEVRRSFRAFHGETGGVVGEAARTALDLARAEHEASRRGWTVEVSQAWERYDDVYGEPAPPGVFMVNVDVRDRRGEILGSLLTSVSDESDPYLRQVAAEVALEALREKRGGSHRGIAGRKNPARNNPELLVRGLRNAQRLAAQLLGWGWAARVLPTRARGVFVVDTNAALAHVDEARYRTGVHLLELGR